MQTLPVPHRTCSGATEASPQPWPDAESKIRLEEFVSVTT